MKVLLPLLLTLTLTSSCLGPGLFKDKDKSLGGKVANFTPALTFNPTTDVYNPLPSVIQVVFSNDVNMLTVSNADFTVSGTGTCDNSNLFVNSSILDHTLTILLNTSSCTSGDEIILMIDKSGIFDNQGRQGMGTITQRYVLDNLNAPTPVINLNAGTVSSFPSSFTMVLDSSIDQSTITDSIFTVSGSGSCPADPYAGYSITGTVVTVQLNTVGCANGDQVTVGINVSMIEDINGNKGIGTITKVLTLDNVGPDASSITTDLATGNYNPLPSSVTFNFPSDIDIDQIPLAAFVGSANGSCPASPVTSMQKIANHLVVALDTSSCQDGDQVSLSLNMNLVKDFSGNIGTGSLSRQFTLLSSIPSAPSFNFESGIYASLPASVTATFDANTNMNTVNAAISASGTGGCSASPFLSSSNNVQVTTILLNTSGCQNGDEIIVSIDMSLVQNNLGVAGNGIIQKTYMLDSQGPSSPIININSGSFNAFPATISLVFDPDTDMSTVNLSSLSLVGSGSCPANAITGISISGTVATVSVDSSLCTSGDNLTLSVDMTQIKDNVGNAGVGTVTRSLTLDTSTPAAPSVNFASGVYKNIPSIITFTFSNIDMSTVDLSDFTYQGNGSCSPTGVVAFSKSSSNFVLQLDTAGCSDTNSVVLYLNMAGIQNTVGTSGSGVLTYTYTRDTSGPASATFSPAGQVSASLPATLSISLPADTDMSTVSLADFALNSIQGCASASITGISIVGTQVTLSINSASCSSGDSFSVTTNFSGISDNAGNAGVGSSSATYGLDTTGPSAASISPASGTLSALPQIITVTFSADTDMSSVSLADFTIAGNGSCQANPVSSSSVSGQVFTINLDTAGCGQGNSISVSLNMGGVTDALGNVGLGSVQTSYSLDSVGLVTSDVAVSPIGKSYTVLPTSVNFTFPAGTDMSTVTTADFTAVGASGCQANSLTNVTKSGNVATAIINTSGCVLNSTVTLTLNLSGVKDLAGNDGTGSIQNIYTLDNQGPAAAVISPATQDFTTMPANASITFTADTDMNSVSAADISVVGSSSCPANASSGFSVSGQVATITLNSAGCIHGGKITLTVNMSGVADAAGNAGSGSVVAIYTRDIVGPASASVSVNSGSFTTLPVSLNFTFAADTNMSSVTLSDFSVIGSGSCLASPATGISQAGQVATLSLNTAGCASGDTITISLDMSQVQDGVGNSGSGIISRVLTLDNQGPAAAVVNIASRVINILPSALTFTFSADTDMNSVTSADFSVVGAGGCPANALSSVTKLGQVATVNLNRTGCVNNSSITATLNMAGVTDATGNAGLGSVSSTLTLDTVAPALPSASVSSGTLQNIPSSINYTFGADTDMSTVTTADFTAVGALGCPVNAVSSVSIAGQVATLNLNTTGCIHNSTMVVTANMAGVSDNAGNVGSGSVVRNFLKDTVGPAVPSVVTQGGTLLTLPNKVIFTFESDVNMSTFDTNDFTVVGLGICLANPYVGMSVAGQVATINLNVAACLNLGIVNVTVNMTGVQDNAGNSGTNSSYLLELKL